MLPSRLPNIIFAYGTEEQLKFFLRQRKPTLSPFLLSSRPHWSQNREDSTNGSRLSDG